MGRLGASRGRAGKEKEQVRARSRPLLGWLQCKPAPGRTLVLAIGKRAGKATVRARVKRILRHSFRQVAAELPEGACVLIAADGDMTAMPRRAVRQAVAGLLDRLSTQWRSQCPSSAVRARPPSPSSGSTKQ